MAQIYGQLQNAQLENLSADPSTSVAGRFYLNTATGTVVVDDGTAKRALLRNDGKAVFGTDATAANNIRFHHAGVAMLQFVPGNDTTTENSVATSLAQVGFRATNLSAAPAVGNVGRIYFNTATSGLQVDTGTVFLQFATLTGTETLTNKTLTTPVIDVFSVTDQSATPATPASGSTKFYSKAGSFYKIASDGLETLIGSGAGGSGSYNYLSNGDFESGVTTVQYVSTSLTNGLPSGAGPTLSNTANSITITSETSAPLRRTKSLRATAASAWSAGQGFSVGPVFTVQPSDLGKILNVTLTYQVVSGSTTLQYGGTPTAQSLAIAVYDVTAAAWLPAPAGSLGFATGTGSQPVTATFQSSVVTGQQYQVFVLNLVASTAAVTVLFDDISVSPNVANSADSRAITFQGAVPASTSMTANSTLLPLTTVIDRGGNWNGTTYTVGVSGDYTVNGTLIVSAQCTITLFVNGTLRAYLGSNPAASTARISLSSLLSNVPAGAAITIRADQNVTITSSNSADLINIVRIGGQSGNTNDARVIAARFSLSASTSVAAAAAIPWNVTAFDTNAAYVSPNYVIPISGIYEISTCGAATATTDVAIYKNGASDSVVVTWTGSDTKTGTAMISCVAGDLISVRPLTACSVVAAARFVIKRLTGPSSVAASESTNATYGLTTAYSAASAAPIKFDTKVVDTHSMYSPATGIATVVSSGTYRLSCTINVSTTGAALTNYVLVNGVGAGILVYISATNVGFAGTLSLRLQAGATVAIVGNTSATYNAVNSTLGYANQFTLERTGN